jgi:sugar/nucleoside kinase (ribokinase family)
VIIYNSSMYPSAPYPEIDYLVIGHITQDLTPQGPRMGGTATFSALTARALGLRVGIVTSWGGEMALDALDQIPVSNYPTDQSTTFENIYTPQGRVQILHHVAPTLDFHHIPEAWRHTPIIHLGPVAQEVEPGLVRHIQSSLVGLTPQGWLRAWDEKGHVYATEWPEAAFSLRQAGAAVISVEDVGNSEERIDEIASYCRILAVTEASHGSRLYWNGDVRRFRPPVVPEVDATGAGDIYAAAFFSRLYSTRDPWEAARFATLVSSFSVTRSGLNSIPTPAEIQDSLTEVL